MTIATASHPHTTLLHTTHESQNGTAVVGNRLSTNMVLSYSYVHGGGRLIKIYSKPSFGSSSLLSPFKGMKS